jgi:hypothetical protein
MLQFIFHPSFAMVVILSSERIVPEKIAPANGAVHHMEDRDLVGCKHFGSCYSRHAAPPSSSGSISS